MTKKLAILSTIAGFLLVGGIGCGGARVNSPINPPANVGENSAVEVLTARLRATGFNWKEIDVTTDTALFKNKETIEKILKWRLPDGEGSVRITIVFLKKLSDKQTVAKQKIIKEIEEQWIEVRKVTEKARAEWLFKDDDLLVALTYKVADETVAEKIKTAAY